MAYRFKDWISRARKSKVLQAQIAASSFYVTGTDPFAAVRHNAGGRKDGIFDLVPSNPAVSPFARIHYHSFDSDYSVNTTSVWDETASGTGTALTVQDAVGNKAKFTNGAGDNEHYYYEYKYEKAQLIAGKDIWFFTSIEIGDVDQADMFVGLCADLASGTLFANRVDCIGFTLADGSGLLNAVCTKDGTGAATTTGLTLSDATEYWVGFHSNGTSYVDFFAGPIGKDQPAWRLTISTNLPDDEILAPAFGLQNGQAVANTMTISDIWTISDR